MFNNHLRVQALPMCCSLLYLYNTDNCILSYPDKTTLVKDVIAAADRFNKEELADNHPNRVYQISGLKGIAIVTNLGYFDRLTLRLKFGFKSSTKYAKGVRLMIAPIRKIELIVNV